MGWGQVPLSTTLHDVACLFAYKASCYNNMLSNFPLDLVYNPGILGLTVGSPAFTPLSRPQAKGSTKYFLSIVLILYNFFFVKERKFETLLIRDKTVNKLHGYQIL